MAIYLPDTNKLDILTGMVLIYFASLVNFKVRLKRNYVKILLPSFLNICCYRNIYHFLFSIFINIQ